MFLVLTALPLAFEYYLLEMLDFNTVLPGYPLGSISISSELCRLLAQYLLWRLSSQMGLHRTGVCHLLDFVASSPTSLLSHYVQLQALGTITVGSAKLNWLQIVRSDDAALNSYCLYDLIPTFVAVRRQHFLLKVLVFVVLAIACYFFEVVT